MPAQTSHWLSVESAIVPASRMERLAATEDDPGRFAGPVHLFHATHAAAAAALADDLGGHWFPDAPNIVSFTVTQQLIDNQLAMQPILDIWHRSFGRSPTAATSYQDRSLRAACSPTSPSESLLETPTPAVLPHGTIGRAPSSTRRVRRALPIRTLTSPAGVADLPFSADTKARLLAALEAGDIVVVPERPVSIGGEERTGWWRIDPMTGWTADEMDDGRGSDMSQRSALATTMTEAAPRCAAWVAASHSQP